MKIKRHRKHNIHIDGDMDIIIRCATCHRKVTVGECYSSQQHFTWNGIWALNVCPKCHKKEFKKIAIERSKGESK